MLVNNNEYLETIESIKQEIAKARYKTTANLNKELIIFYHNIGKIINTHKIWGNKFVGDSYNCFNATLNEQENLLFAIRYWNNEPNQYSKKYIKKILVNGDILKWLR